MEVTFAAKCLDYFTELKMEKYWFQPYLEHIRKYTPQSRRLHAKELLEYKEPSKILTPK